MSGAQAKAKAATKPTPEQVQEILPRLQSELKALAGKVGELESEADEHELVLSTLKEVAQHDPDRKCFRLVGGVLTERTVKDVVPALQVNRDGIKTVIQNLAEQYKKKEEEFDSFKREFGLSPVEVS